MNYEDIKRVNEQMRTIDIKGKEYAEVNTRVLAFRELEPEGSIETEILSCDGGVVVMQATIKNGEGKVLASGTAYEKEASTFINKTSYIENCETSAVGRALGFIGLGIDTSIASAEEVQNAQLNQNKRKAKPLTRAELEDKIVALCDAKRLRISDVCKQAKVTELSELDEERLQKVIEWINDK